MVKKIAKALGYLLPNTFFGRLALLLFVVALVSHVLALTLMFQRRPDPQERRQEQMQAHGSPEHGRPSGFYVDMLLDTSVRLGAMLLAAWIGARWLSRPMRQLAHAARELGKDVAHQPPLPETGVREFREASHVFNQMQAQIRRQLDERDRFVAAVSHDLRTPLTRLRLRAESLADAQERQSFQRDIAAMDEMIRLTLDYLLGVADEEPFVLLDVLALVHSIADEHPAQHAVQVLIEDEGWGIKPLRAQASALRRALGNLVDNAVRYGEQATIVLKNEPQRLRIEISDHGQGIAQDQLAQVFEPFYRVEASRNRHTGGTGLGLSIARDIVHRHHGSLALRNREAGGLMAVVELPRQIN